MYRLIHINKLSLNIARTTFPVTILEVSKILVDQFIEGRRKLGLHVNQYCTIIHWVATG